MSVQRRRGMPVVIYPQVRIVDARGNEQFVADRTRPVTGRAWAIPQRSSRAEVPGQVEVNVYRIGVDASLSETTLWAEVEWNGSDWDVAAPPAYHNGTRHTRHWSIDIRERPHG